MENTTKDGKRIYVIPPGAISFQNGRILVNTSANQGELMFRE